VANLRDELSPAYVDRFIENSNITPVDERRHPAHGIIGIVMHVTAVQAEAIRAGYTGDAIVDPELHIGFTEIAQLAGVSVGTVQNRFAALPDKPTTYRLRSSRTSRPADFVDRQWGVDFADTLRPAELPPDRVTLDMIAKYFGMQRGSMYPVLLRRFNKPEKIQLPGISPVAVYPLQAITQLLDEGRAPAEGAPQINREQLPFTAEDLADPDKFAYARQLHEQLLMAKWATVDMESAITELRVSSLALSILARRLSRGTWRADEPIPAAIIATIRRTRFAAPPEGWVSHSRLVSLNPQLSHLAAQGYFNPTEYQLYRPSRDRQLDVYYPLHVARQASGTSGRSRRAALGAVVDHMPRHATIEGEEVD
jgi:hypothetical protein